MDMWYTSDANNITLQVYVQPGAKSTEIVGLQNNLLKIRLKTPPIEGRANEALLKFIAKLFNVPPREVQLIRGEKARHKTLKIIGSCINPEVLKADFTRKNRGVFTKRMD